jgi:hypothetical protein
MEENMVTKKLARSLLLLGLLFSLLIGATTVNAASRNCSLASLKGAYGDLEQGTVLMDIGFGTPPFPVALSGIVTYDGKGEVSATYTVSFNGVLMPGTATGTYTVNPDCTYSDEITPYPSGPASHHAGTITGEGISQRVDFVYTDPWLVASGTLRKIVSWGCSLRTLKGTYEVFGQGEDTSMTIPILGFPSPPFPAAHVGIFTADGAGHFSGHDVEKVDVVAAPTTFTATYTVNPDCTVSFTITETIPTPGGPVTMTAHETGTITGWGDSQEVHSIMTDAGWVFVDTAKRQ